MKIIVNGAGGAMGKVLCDIIAGSERHEAVAFCSLEFTTDRENKTYKSINEYDGEADCIIDFSHHSATEAVTAYAVKRAIPLVIATTGQTDDEKNMIAKASERIPLFCSANMSFGVAVLSCLAKIVAKAMPGCDIEIIEKHHNRKLDVPSGTALLLADGIKSVREECEYNIGRHENGKRSKNEIGIHAVRMGNEVGTHEVIFATNSQVITLRHEAENRGLFAEGAITAAEFLVTRDAGYYNMDDILD